MNLKAPSFRLDGKRALVVGASSGIGQAAAFALAAYGAEVWLAARRVDELEQAVAHINSNGGAAKALPMDVVRVADCESLIAENGPFEVLVNAAGMARHGPALETREEDFDAVVAVNIKAAYFLLRAVAGGLIAAGKGGSLITISSQMAHTGGVDRAVYCASKHAVEGMTKAMAVEWGKAGIRVNSICPTFVRTALTAPTFDNPGRVRWIEEKIKLGRVGEVEDITGAVVYLASEVSALVTGTALMVDGGWTAG